MMKLTLFSLTKSLIVLSVFAFMACTTPSTVQGPKIDKEVNYRHTNLVFSPEAVEKEPMPGLRIAAKPVDAAQLNRATYLSAVRDGNYEKEIVETIDFERSRLRHLPIAEQRRLERYLRISELLIESVGEEKVSPVIAELMIRRILIGESSDGSETDHLTGQRFTDIFNPFRVNNRYLSVVELDIMNSGSSVANLGFDRFQIVNDNELLYPLRNSYFENIFTSNSELLQNVFRMNLPDQMLITQGQNIVKYISFPAIGIDSRRLTIQFIDEGQVTDFSFAIEVKQFDSKIILNQYRVDHANPRSQYDLSRYSDFYFVLEFSQGGGFALNAREFFVDTERLRSSTNRINICGLGVSRDEHHLWGCTGEFIPNELNRDIRFELDYMFKLRM